MGIFDRFLKAIGFEEKDETETVTEKEVPKKKEKKQELPLAKFDLREKRSNPKTYYPSSQEEIEEVVGFYAGGENVDVDLSKFSEDDKEHIIDFLSGATCAIKGNIKKISDCVYGMRHWWKSLTIKKLR